jgi:predicted nucleic acid-binding protein
MIFVDTDALIGLINPDDALHSRATELYEQIDTPRLTILPETLGEFATLVTIRLGRVTAQHLVETIADSHTIITIDERAVRRAIELYLQQTSKENSLNDCYVMSASELYNAECIFSFDKGYIQNGFELLEDYLKAQP